MVQFGAVLFVGILVPFFGWPFFALTSHRTSHPINWLNMSERKVKWAIEWTQNKYEVEWARPCRNKTKRMKRNTKTIKHNSSTSWSKGCKHFVILAWIPTFRPRKPTEMHRKFHCARICCVYIVMWNDCAQSITYKAKFRNVIIGEVNGFSSDEIITKLVSNWFLIIAVY